MVAKIENLLQEISREHFPYAPAHPDELADFERRMGWKLDPDLRAFYLHCNGAELIERLPNSPYLILPLGEIVRARVAIFGKRKDDDQHGPASVYAICDVQDGNFVLMDVSRQQNGHYPLIDGYHEAWPDPAYCRQIASSFAEFLERALRTREPAYWLRSMGP
ncbi:SMI1/KNR4 family protein [Stigmatella aurantiaca]|nr:SMI1/KNR4 family protein [Stigmatella aurantiaca]ADO67871.1 conserved uncharacterized protein [Stigmatella aurantiaca DW4/3-1]